MLGSRLIVESLPSGQCIMGWGAGARNSSLSRLNIKGFGGGRLSTMAMRAFLGVEEFDGPLEKWE